MWRYCCVTSPRVVNGMSPPPTEIRKPKQARAIRTRERILAQAEIAFAVRGFEAASLTSDILEPAGISVGSFYHQFADKRAVLHALVEERRREWHTRVDELAGRSELTGLADAVAAALITLLDDVDRHPHAWWILFRELHNAEPEIRSLFEVEWGTWLDLVGRLVDPWVTAPDGCAPGTIAFVAAGLAGLVRRYLAADEAARAELRASGVEQAVHVCSAALAVNC